MSTTVLQAILKFALNFCITLGIAFMVICTVFIIISIIKGDIRISKVNNESGNSKK